MGARRPWLVLSVLLSAATALADDHNSDLCVGAPSWVSGSPTTWGIHASFAILGQSKAKHDLGNPKKWGGVADFSIYSGSEGTETTRLVFLAGARYSFPGKVEKVKDLKGQETEHRRLWLPFFQVLSGVMETKDASGNVTDPVIGGGLGVDVLFSTKKDRTWGFRGQVDGLARLSDKVEDRWLYRVSGGIVYRFH
jgi:hypothetical protein